MTTSATKNKPNLPDMPVASILLENTQYSFDMFFQQFKTKWHANVEPYREKNALGMIIEGQVVGCAVFPCPCEDPALQAVASSNAMWPDAMASVLKHRAHLKVALARARDPVKAHVLISKVICSLLQQKNTVGVFLGPGYLAPAYYMKHAEAILDGGLPTELWVHINSSRAVDGSLTLHTTGMRKFGKNEFEVVETKCSYINAYYSLMDIIKYTIANNVAYKKGDRLGPDENSKKVLSVSDGAKAKGITVKIEM